MEPKRSGQVRSRPRPQRSIRRSAGAPALRARPLGIGREQRRIDRVGLGEGLAHIIENAGIARRVGPPRAAVELHLGVYRFFAGGPFWATAAFTSALNAPASTFSSSWMSIALRVLPSKLELKRRDGSGCPQANQEGLPQSAARSALCSGAGPSGSERFGPDIPQMHSLAKRTGFRRGLAKEAPGSLESAYASSGRVAFGSQLLVVHARRCWLYKSARISHNGPVSEGLARSAWRGPEIREVPFRCASTRQGGRDRSSHLGCRSVACVGNRQRWIAAAGRFTGSISGGSISTRLYFHHAGPGSQPRLK